MCRLHYIQNRKTIRMDKISDGYYLGEIPSSADHDFTKLLTVDKAIETAVFLNSYDFSRSKRIK